MMKWLLAASLVVLCCHCLVLAKRSKLRPLHAERSGGNIVAMDEVSGLIQEKFRSKRAASDHQPVVHGSYSFSGDSNNFANIQYMGSNSPVIFVLTFLVSNGQINQPRNARLYRSSDYGASFSLILNQLDSSDSSPSLWRNIFISQGDQSMVVVQNSQLAKFYYSLDEGVSWTVRTISPSTISPSTISWNPANPQMALAHDPTNRQLYVTQTLGREWIKISDFVAPRDYQWGDPAYDEDSSVVYFNTFDGNDPDRGDFSVSLFTQRAPFNDQSRREFDPNLGRHDDFLLLGPYIFAQKTDARNVVSLYVSYSRNLFQKAKIPASDAHQDYLVAHIDEQQAVVVVRHTSGQYNLYISELTGVFFAQSLPDVVFEDNFGIDIELIEGVNGTIMANQYVRTDPSQPGSRVRTLISLDNGGNWELVSGRATSNCLPPQCSLHFNMTRAYARTGIYSQASAPGIILAHGNTGTTLDSGNHDLFISRDGGVSWSQTLQGSWGITVVDHGGLLVAAKDYRQTPSRVLHYSCDEGAHWSDFQFTDVDMTVFGVVTEPGEHTTTVSMYGVKGSRTWDVVTINFSSIFLRTCSPADYYSWHPWDIRSARNCLLGSSVVIERRINTTCCLIGRDYTRPTSFSVCQCSLEDFECDYGYMRAEGLTGSCVRDNDVSLPPPSCEAGAVTYMESQGYRKVAGDVCSGGVEATLGVRPRPCCVTTTGNSSVNSNECTLSPSPCHAHATCFNTPTSFACLCQSGYSGDGLSYGTGCTSLGCGSFPCDLNARCTDTTNGFFCTCKEGFVGNGTICFSGYPTANSATQTSSSPIVLIILGVLLAIAIICVVVFGLLALKLYFSLQKYRRPSGVGGIHYRTAPAEEEPLTLNSDRDDDDDEPLLT